MDADQKNELPLEWKKTQIVGQTLALVLIPVVIALIGFWYTHQIKTVEVQVRLLETAMQILQQNPDETDFALRWWASDYMQNNRLARMDISVVIPDEIKDKIVQEKLGFVLPDIEILLLANNPKIRKRMQRTYEQIAEEQELEDKLEKLIEEYESKLEDVKQRLLQLEEEQE